MPEKNRSMAASKVCRSLAKKKFRDLPTCGRRIRTQQWQADIRYDLAEVISKNRPPRHSLTPALEAIGKLWKESFIKLKFSGELEALIAHDEIMQILPRSTIPFYRHFLPLRIDMVALLADTYRRYFKLALANPCQAGRDPDKWARGQLQFAVSTTLEWVRSWHMLACDGKTQFFWPIATVEQHKGNTTSLAIPTTDPPFPPPSSWRAPAWLFEISGVLVGIERMKKKHVPMTDSEQKLGAGHTRLLLKGARRVLLRELGKAIETVRNEEIAAVGAIPVETVTGQRRRINKRKGWEQREKLYRAIREALASKPAPQGKDLCAELDKRHAPPLLDWRTSGEWPEGLTWKQAWRNPSLRVKIRRVRQGAQKTR
jgi:hypothetical protein